MRFLTFFFALAETRFKTKKLFRKDAEGLPSLFIVKKFENIGILVNFEEQKQQRSLNQPDRKTFLLRGLKSVGNVPKTLPKRSLANLISFFELFIQLSIPKLSRHYQENNLNSSNSLFVLSMAVKSLNLCNLMIEKLFESNCAPISKPKFLK